MIFVPVVKRRLGGSSSAAVKRSVSRELITFHKERLRRNRLRRRIRSSLSELHEKDARFAKAKTDFLGAKGALPAGSKESREYALSFNERVSAGIGHNHLLHKRRLVRRLTPKAVRRAKAGVLKWAMKNKGVE